MRRACSFFKHPEQATKNIHIAGTNGKGSVARMIFQMLKDAGKTVGIYTSPHLFDIRERFSSHRGIISREKCMRYMQDILAYPEELTFFERCTLLAFLYFRDIDVEFSVIEVGV